MIFRRPQKHSSNITWYSQKEKFWILIYSLLSTIIDLDRRESQFYCWKIWKIHIFLAWAAAAVDVEGKEKYLQNKFNVLVLWGWTSSHLTLNICTTTKKREDVMFALGCHKFLSHSEYSFCWMHNLNLHTDQHHQAQIQSQFSTPPFCVTFHKTHNFYLVSFCAIVQWFFHVNSRPAASRSTSQNDN